jgi:hypothetical protein
MTFRMRIRHLRRIRLSCQWPCHSIPKVSFVASARHVSGSSSGTRRVIKPRLNRCPKDGYSCPYCAVRAPIDHWWTPAQLERAREIAFREVVHPELKKLENLNRSGDFLSLEVAVPDPDELAPLDEANDMHRIDFPCHPTEPIKVVDDWREGVHCLICARRT